MSSELERLKKEAARDPSALIKLADTLVAEGRGAEAVQVCRKGVATRPADVSLKLALGRALMAVGSLKEAQSVLAEATASAPDADAPEPLETADEFDDDRPTTMLQKEKAARAATLYAARTAASAPARIRRARRIRCRASSSGSPSGCSRAKVRPRAAGSRTRCRRRFRIH
jgi:predicted Zn-dependent protease